MTIYEVLKNAQFNLTGADLTTDLRILIGIEQLNNALNQIDSGKDLTDEFEGEE